MSATASQVILSNETRQQETDRYCEEHVEVDLSAAYVTESIISWLLLVVINDMFSCMLLVLVVLDSYVVI